MRQCDITFNSMKVEKINAHNDHRERELLKRQ